MDGSLAVIRLLDIKKPTVKTAGFFESGGDEGLEFV